MADEEKDNKAIEALEAKLATLEASMQAKIDAAEGKAAGILERLTKQKEEAAAKQAEIDELKSKDMGEVEKMQVELERMKSRVEAAEAKATEAEQTLTSTQRKNALNEIGKQFKWLDSVPDSLRSMTLDNEFADIDLGNEVLVLDKVKNITTNYAGLLSADVANGAGAKPGDSTSSAKSTGVEQLLQASDDEIMKDPKAFMAQAYEAQTNN